MKGRAVCVMLKTIYFKEKVSIKRPWMEGWTSYVILKKLYMRFSVGSDFHIALDNMKFIQVNFIQSYREMKFGGNSQTCITLWRKILRPRKKMEYEQILFSKNRAPRIWGGGRFASVCKNNVIFGNVVYYSEKKMFFKISHLQKNVKKCPWDTKTALGISGVGEG